MSKQSRFDSPARLRPFNRRNFLKAAGSAAILPAVLPAFGAQSSGASANNSINLGVIGMGWQGPGNTEAFLASEEAESITGQLFCVRGAEVMIPNRSPPRRRDR